MLRMRHTLWFIWRLLIAIVLTSPYAHAQYTANSQTNLISGVTSNWSGPYYVGNASSADALLIQSSGVLNDSGAYLGYSSTSSYNSALVTDTGSIWSNGFLYVGFNGIGNSLVISNGAQVLNDGEAWVSQGFIARIGSNSVVVTGSSSVWSNGQSLSVGDPGACNGVLVNHGGLLINNNGSIGSYYAGSSNNSVVVSDSGSVWTNSGDLYVGYWGSSNSLTVSNGAGLFCGYGYVGSEIGTSNNSLLVSGAGSLWTNRNDLSIGYSGVRNSLTILNSGVVFSVFGYIGNNAPATSNSVLVAGTGSVWRISASLYVGNSGGGNDLVISNGGRVASGVYSYVGYNSSTNSVLVSGPGSLWNSSMYTYLYLGYSGAGNSLVISNGGAVLSDQGTIGLNASSSSNRVLIAGSGSIWSNSSSFCLGYYGSANSLVISNGGKLFNGYGSVGNKYGSGSNNSALVTGTGSVWRSDSLTISTGGSSNTLVINNGGMVVDGSGSIAAGGGRNNSVLVTGPGSMWTNTSLSIGDSGNGNSLVVSNGAHVINGIAYVGCNFTVPPFPSTNEARVADGGVWQNGALYVGYGGSRNRVVVAGGSVLATSLVIGATSPTCDNFVELDSGSLFVTNATGDAVLEVRNGTLVLNGGTLQVDTFVMTNACGLFVPHGGTLLYNHLVLDPNLSALGDGIPNGWKQQYGFDPLNPAVATTDPDGDGFSNLQEYLAGTDPTNSASYFHIVCVTPTNAADVLVSWVTGDERTNALQATAGDTSGGYNTNGFADIFTVTNTLGTVTNYLDAGAATNFPARYYRVRVVP
jgi:T5SS/PEP-CTERM-associated repeat protein